MMKPEYDNAVLRQLAKRKSVRAFEDRPIAPANRAAILEAACQAPTAGNQQLYTIIDVTDPEKKAMLADSCDHQPFIATAPMLLVFCADCLKWRDAYLAAGCDPRESGAGDLLLAVIDAAIAAQNAVTAAWSLGIGSCYIGDILENREAQKHILGLPDQVVPAVLLVFGHPTEQQRGRRKPDRAAMEYIVHENAYHRLDPAELEAMLSPRAGAMGFAAWVKAFCERKFNSDFSREMTRSVRAYLEEFEYTGIDN